MSQWTHIMTPDEIDAHHAMTASLDPRFARCEREFYESRTADQLATLVAQEWQSNCPTGYQLARSYAAKLAAK